MSEHPQTWHYGLVAQWWAEFNVASEAELAFYRSAIERHGEPVLDLACGTGRLLLPLLRAGVDVDGCDLSPDMLAICREQAARDGPTPRLFAQAMHELDPPRRYRTIYCCDAFGLGGERAHDEATLRRCRQHLEPGGALIFNLYLPYDSAEEWVYWLPERRLTLPQPWPAQGDRRESAGGDEYEMRVRLVDLDPLAQRVKRESRMTLRRAGEVVAEEEYNLWESLYFQHEVLTMLDTVGFSDITVEGGYTGSPPAPDQTMVVFIARA